MSYDDWKTTEPDDPYADPPDEDELPRRCLDCGDVLYPEEVDRGRCASCQMDFYFDEVA